jgi:hypothetical protein
MCRILCRAFDKYGIGNFAFSILVVCAKEDAVKREQFCIDLPRPEYNIQKRAGSLLGVRHPETAKSRTVVRGMHHSAITITQYTMDGEKIRDWDCIKDAKEALGFTNTSAITGFCDGRDYSAAGYRWSRKGKNLPKRTDKRYKRAA